MSELLPGRRDIMVCGRWCLYGMLEGLPWYWARTIGEERHVLEKSGRLHDCSVLICRTAYSVMPKRGDLLYRDLLALRQKTGAKMW